MVKNTLKNSQEYETVPFRMHPRIFAALGADLVTNDVVAVIELVKNSYDAFANNVWVRFRDDYLKGMFLEIEDDGEGMTRDIIENEWCFIATPYKLNNPFIWRGNKKRRVSGEKGLGRLSVARLGEKIQMITQAPDSDCWELVVNWSDISSSDNISSCFGNFRRYPKKSPFNKSGTLLRIYSLKGYWDESRITDLDENLARLISPFSEIKDFNIFICKSDKSGTKESRIESPEFLSKPKYSIKGSVDVNGNLTCTYIFNPIGEGNMRKRNLEHSWEQIYDSIQDRKRFPFMSDKAHCGPFSFEIRAWDIGSEDTDKIAEKFELQKSQVRKDIRVHKGISVYRDNILILPKSENARDWLGLDLRRVSRVGTRMSTSQLVGYVSISAEKNPKIDDTSDRERLASNLEVAEFEELLKTIIELLEIERSEDRAQPERKKSLENLFDSLSAEKILADVIALDEEGAPVSEAVSILQEFKTSLDNTRKTIQERFVYYSRLATVGTIAQMLVHEIRNRTTAIGSLLDFVKSRFGPFRNRELEEEYLSADNAVNALERLADTFSPLASRSFRRRIRHSILEERIRECRSLQCGEIKRKNIKYRVPDSETHVAVDPGELDAILLNLINNAVYWLGQVNKEEREIDFLIEPVNNENRVYVWVHDTGPGLHEEDVEKVFWPGVTRKPGGIGMGLTVASELVAEYGGRMFTKYPGEKGGASFAFDLPLRK